LIFFPTPMPEPSKRGIFSMEAIAFVLLMAAFIRSEITESLHDILFPANAPSRAFKFKDAFLVLFVLLGSLLIYAAAVNLLGLA